MSNNRLCNLIEFPPQWTQELLEGVTMLRCIHIESATTCHGIKPRGEWEPYIPTHFIYAFFTFNTLYNINWQQSILFGNIINFDSKNQHKSSSEKPLTEREKINEFLSYCFKDNVFVNRYKKSFIKYITHHYCCDDILKELEYIQLDRKNSNGLIDGSIRDEDTIVKFQTACSDCLIHRKFDYHTINTIVQFIYGIRCNLFHGHKTLEDLNFPSQQIRLDFYSSFIIAINQMIFSYLQFQRDEDISNDLGYLLESSCNLMYDRGRV